LKIITALDERESDGFFKIIYVFGVPKENIFLAPYILVKDEFSSVSSVCMEAALYERRIQTFFGLNCTGLEDKRSLILHENWPKTVYPLRKEFKWNERPNIAKGKYEFKKIAIEGVYEIPVGPVHAGIIEPGHFRFSALGEEIVNLEPRLGFQHKGSEKLFETLDMKDKLKLSARISGDSSFSHSLAFCEAVEKLCDTDVPARAKYLRIVYAELERLANHMGDIGAIMIDTGFNFGGSNGARLREKIMQINERLTGSRFLRGVNLIGGVSKDIDAAAKNKLMTELDQLMNDFEEVIQIAKNSPSLLNRLKTTGKLSEMIAREYNVLGVAGRAAGISADARIDYPYEAYAKFPFEIFTETYGDVYARFNVRIAETRMSVGIIKKALETMPEGKIAHETREFKLKKNFHSASLVEGWRGEIFYMISTDKDGVITRVSLRDPSFHNWTVLGLAGKGNIVPDFPLINKSFNLSYSGNDL
jgi:Ni,Fe-hydrogenase III large subunit